MLENIRRLLGAWRPKPEIASVTQAITPAAALAEAREACQRRLEDAAAPCRSAGAAAMECLPGVEAAVAAVAARQLDEGDSWHGISEVHRKQFLERTGRALEKLKQTTFKGDCHAIEGDERTLKDALAAITKAAADNRYMYTFFPDEMAGFNRQMKSLAEAAGFLEKEAEGMRRMLETSKKLYRLSELLEVKKKRRDELAAELALLHDETQADEAIAGARSRAPTATERLEPSKRLEQTGAEQAALAQEWTALAMGLEKTLHETTAAGDTALAEKTGRFLKAHKARLPRQHAEELDSLLARLEKNTGPQTATQVNATRLQAAQLLQKADDLERQSAAAHAQEQQHRSLIGEVEKLELLKQERRQAARAKEKQLEELGKAREETLKETEAAAGELLGRKIQVER